MKLIFTATIVGLLFGNIDPCVAQISESEFKVDTVATGLTIPWDIDFTPDGRIFITERPGRIRVILSNGELMEEPWAELNVANWQAAGLSGLAPIP